VSLIVAHIINEYRSLILSMCIRFSASVAIFGHVISRGYSAVSPSKAYRTRHCFVTRSRRRYPTLLLPVPS
jgi:hypothetical protein